MVLIGLTGVAGSGKNYIADQIQKKYESVRQIAFADPLKQMVHHMFGVPLEDLYTEAGKARQSWYKWEWCRPAMDRLGSTPEYMTNRDLLQWCGTDLVRNCWNDQHWVDLAQQKIQHCADDIVVVTDVRFTNEANLITGMSGTVLRPVGRRSEGVPQHVSEAVDGIVVGGMIDNSPGMTAEQIMLQVEAYVPGLDRCRVRA